MFDVWSQTHLFDCIHKDTTFPTLAVSNTATSISPGNKFCAWVNSSNQYCSTHELAGYAATGTDAAPHLGH